MSAADNARLKRVFQLELERGCTNQAVIGGLDRMFIQMDEDGLLEIGGALRRMVAELPPGGYRNLDEPARKRWLERTIRALDGIPTIPSPAPPTNVRTLAPNVTPLPQRRTSAQAKASTISPAQQKTSRRTAPPLPPQRERGQGGEGHPSGQQPTANSQQLSLTSPLTKLPGIGPAAVPKFEKLGVTNAGEAAVFYPRRYNDFTDLRPIAQLQPSTTPQTVIATVFSVREMRFGKRVRGAEAMLQDRTGSLKVAWFNMPYVARQLEEGQQVVVSGKVRAFRGRLQMENPEFEPADAELMHTGRLVPVYPATAGLAQRTIRRAVKAAVDALAPQVPDAAPAWLRSEARVAPLGNAVRELHYPESFGHAERARQAIALREFLAIQVAVLMRRAEWQQGRDAPRLDFDRLREPFLASLPWQLTGAQARALDDITRDIRGPHPMLRLLQGDVGSGKTVVAFAAMLAAVASGYQAVLMAPTEILADQHYRSLSKMLGGSALTALDGVFAPEWLRRPLRALLLTGSLTPQQKEQIRSDAAHGGADIVIGTHALLEDDVQIPRLGLAVVDEQHRFGVLQRAKLRQKGDNPHLLVMTATPIPRTLALTVYGDLEVSSITEMPPGRKPIKTEWVQPLDRETAYRNVRRRLDDGEQVYVICPLVEESEALDVRSAEEEFERLRTGPLKDYRLELLHGRMPGRQKDEVMERFASKEAQVLVSTSVIEVGIDVPNATVIIIEGAERFGLSQLHQFRGRVGRSEKQSYCFLFSTGEDPGPDAHERLQAMVETTDGFKLAEVDLEMRGEGEAWGRVQSGANAMLRVARISDRDILLRARDLAAQVLARDPQLQKPEHHQLAAIVKPFLARATEAN
ncbi:MAG: ATP-dependent DNA helicase RecG [Dehalococcoidia bacterium]|nr:ATP-dependent DNA helicase RecG [Dehalococcoidia bacterium]